MGAVGADSSVEGSVLSLPKGGGAISGLGETFAPDRFTGTGNYSVPLALPPGRPGLTPQLSLGYSTGTGNGPFGLGWQLSVPGVSRKTSHGVPRYAGADVFLLSGAEDLVQVAGSYPGRVTYRPRTEGLFARIEHVRDDTTDHWEVRTKDGLLSRYATTTADPVRPDHVFAWALTDTTDLLGNVVRYDYLRDGARALLQRVSYADHGDQADAQFLVTVEFDYETRPDPVTDRRPGFALGTSQRCTTIRSATRTADGTERVAREYRLTYQQAPFSGVSLLSRIDAVGIDGTAEEALPPLTFGYSSFDPAGRRFERVEGPGLPAVPLSDPTLTLVDVRGCGLPDVVELGRSVKRTWANAGSGRFELPRTLPDAPPQSLADPGVRVLDADGDGRPDLFVATATGTTGYFPMSFDGGWDQRGFRPYRQVPAGGLAAPDTALLDLDGDGLTDLLRSGDRLRAWFNDRDPRTAWSRDTAAASGTDLPGLSDPRLRIADMTGDGLADLVVLRSGNLSYRPSLGNGRWGASVTMGSSPRFPHGWDPRRVLLADIDGDGAADLVYVDDGRVLLWGNRGGAAFTAVPLVVTGTPEVRDTDSVLAADLHGTGMAGLLFSRAADGTAHSGWRFLDFTGGVKPHLLTAVDNHLGATTTVTYRPSTEEFLRDAATPTTRWRTTLPFGVHVVSRVEVHDTWSGSRLVTEYRYHHGYWDGVEREFRGFACVEQLDTDTRPGAAGHHIPTLARTWFHPGPVAATTADDWTELDLTREYWPGDRPLLSRPDGTAEFLAGLSRAERRSALRAMRGHELRSELYALDADDAGADRAARPYTVTESLPAVRQVAPGVFFAFGAGSRTTQWERGDEPMTRLEIPAGYDEYGFPAQLVTVAVPRGRDPRSGGRLGDDPTAVEPYLATVRTTSYARREEPGGIYLVDRVCGTAEHEVVERLDGGGSLSATALVAAALAGGAPAATVSLRPIGRTVTFFDGPAFVGLPYGQVGDHGLAVRTEVLAFPEEFLGDLHSPGGRPIPPYLAPSPVAWTDDYPAEFRTPATGVAELAGYRHRQAGELPDAPAGFWAVTERRSYDVHDPDLVGRGRVMVALDPFGAATRTGYDVHELLPVSVTDAGGLTTTAEYDLRLLTPRVTTDPNGNSVEVRYSPAGLVTAHFVRGRDGDGDRDAPSTTLAYDLLAPAEDRGPASVTTLRRVRHDTDATAPPEERDAVVRSVQFSDGFGRVLQTRTQAEDVLFGDPTFGGAVIPPGAGTPAGETAGRPRGAEDNVVVNGWQVYDDKGRVVEKYEPFYSAGYGYGRPGDAQLGRKAIMSYDPRGQLVRTDHPDGSRTVVVLGIPDVLGAPESYRPTPWVTFTYDRNDNAGRTHGNAANGYRDHWDTPASVTVDALGRTVLAVARNGAGADDRIETRTAYDIQGNVVAIVDALGRTAFSYVYDLLKRRWRMDSVDAGRHDSVPDAAGRVVEERDARDALTLASFDVLHRPERVWARDGGDVPATRLRQLIGYGDGGDAGQDPAERAAARALNLLGRASRSYDEAGVVVSGGFDFKGNALSTTRQVIADGPVLAGYETAAQHGWEVVPFAVEWTPAPGQDRPGRDAELLDAKEYTHETAYDALNRVVRHTLPADVTGHRAVLTPRYERSGALAGVDLDGVPYVRRLAHDAKGQRVLVAYGNGIMTRYCYDPDAFRLARLRTEAYTVDGAGLTYRPAGAVLQDLAYGYDLTGNVLAIQDRTPGCGVAPTPDALDRAFRYDPVYRLVRADGREAASPVGELWSAGPRGDDPTATQTYAEQYRYDKVGNLLQLLHSAAIGFTRDFEVEADSNRLLSMTAAGLPYRYSYDPGGNLVSETESRQFSWNHADRMSAFQTRTAGAEPSVHAQYLYDAAGERVLKLVRRQGGAVEVVRYLGGFEHHRWSGGENNHVHVLDGTARVALVRAGPAHPDDRGPAVAYQLGDHLSSCTATVDGVGALTNREEYTPYGETSFGSYSLKRYRFTGCERDSESGLNYHSARYYAPWLARWTSTDPIGVAGGINQYRYSASNPACRTDPSGRDPASTGGDYGNIQTYRKQPRAVRDSSGARLTESEHVMPGAQLREATTDPHTGKSDYQPRHYRNQTTLRVERRTALEKTHGGPTADNARTAALKEKIQTGGSVDYRKDVFEPSLQELRRAQGTTGSATTEVQANLAALAQDGEFFATQTVQETGARLAEFERAEALAGAGAGAGGAVRLGASGIASVASLAGILDFGREANLASQGLRACGPLTLNDEIGSYYLREDCGTLGVVCFPYKEYTSGPLHDIGFSLVEISNLRYLILEGQAAAEWGYVNFWGNFVEGRQGRYWERPGPNTGCALPNAEVD